MAQNLPCDRAYRPLDLCSAVRGSCMDLTRCLASLHTSCRSCLESAMELVLCIGHCMSVQGLMLGDGGIFRARLLGALTVMYTLAFQRESCCRFSEQEYTAKAKDTYTQSTSEVDSAGFLGCPKRLPPPGAGSLAPLQFCERATGGEREAA